MFSPDPSLVRGCILEDVHTRRFQDASKKGWTNWNCFIKWSNESGFVSERSTAPISSCLQGISNHTTTIKQSVRLQALQDLFNASFLEFSPASCSVREEKVCTFHDHSEFGPCSKWLQGRPRPKALETSRNTETALGRSQRIRTRCSLYRLW